MNANHLEYGLGTGKHALTLAIVFVTVIQAMSGITEPEMNRQVDPRAKQAIQKLWSPDQLVREQGRKEVMRIGSAAINPLIELLSDLLKNKSPRFAAGKEEEGQKALKDYVNLIRKTRGPVLGSEESKALSSFVINTRLISDCIFLLGELRAIEAVSILIYIMENRTMSNSIDAEMQALINIGVPAVPFLIKSIENANATAREFEPVFFGYEIPIDWKEIIGEQSDTHQDNLELDEEDDETAKQIALEIKAKAIKVLGEIGNQSALPFLESLNKTVDSQFLNHMILQAIKRIKNEPPSSEPKSPTASPKPKPLEKI